MATRSSASPSSEIEASSATDLSDEDRVLIDQIEQRRTDLTKAADVLKGPLRAVNQVENVVRKVVPLLPYAIAAIAVIGVASALLGRRRLRPSLMVATGLNLWRLWNSANNAALLLTPAATSLAQQTSKDPLKEKQI